MRTRLLGLAVLVLAVALGIALGAGPLQHDTAQRERDAKAQAAQLASSRARVAALRAEVQAGAAYDDATAVTAVKGTLTGHDVALVALPGADPKAVAALRSLLAAAGGSITADVALGAPMTSVSSRQLVEALTSQMVTQAGLPVPASSDGYQRFGLLLGRAIGVAPSAHAVSAAYDPAALSIVAGFQTAGLVTSAKVTARAALVLVVTGPSARTADGAAENAIPVSYLRELSGQAAVVVAGPSSAAGALGIIGSLRSGSPGLTTADGTELTRGRVVAVLALAARTRGVVGDYGSIGHVAAPIPPA